MNPSTQNLQLQYQAFINTPLLWKNSPLNNMKQLDLTPMPVPILSGIHTPNIRLGKRVEQFVMHYLAQFENIKLVTTNAQIQDNNRTVGELDCILRLNQTPIHLEIIYKFYLYDPSIGLDELSHWIGPNRNDNLIKKLTKLSEKQLPLLYSKHCESLLESLGLKATDIQQRVYFKAQLFVPYQQTVPFSIVNKACVQGFYIRFRELEQFYLCKFYLPEKIDWLLEVQTQTSWKSYLQFQREVKILNDAKKAPLCWIKFPNGILQKFFVVWWD